MNRLIPFSWLLALTLGAPAPTEAGPLAEVSWLTDKSGAFSAASEASKPLIIDFWAVWCVPCKEMDETTYRDARVVEAMADFVPLKVDADLDKMLVEMYEVDAFPTVLILDENKREITRLLGMVESEPLLELMRTVSEGYRSYVDAAGQKKDPDALASAAAFLLKVGNPEAARKLLKRALKLSKGERGRQRAELELAHADALIATGEAAAACKELESLTGPDIEPGLRGKAMLSLIRAERERGNEKKAEKLLDRLRAEFPDLAPTRPPALDGEASQRAVQ